MLEEKTKTKKEGKGEAAEEQEVIMICEIKRMAWHYVINKVFPYEQLQYGNMPEFILGSPQHTHTHKPT